MTSSFERLRANAPRPEPETEQANGRSDLPGHRVWRLRALGSLRHRLRESVMSFDYTLGAVGGVLVLIYLVIALLRSEKF